MTQLRAIFDQNLGYETDAFQIPSQSPASALNQKVADFVHRYDDKNTLLVLYYAGHGFEEDENVGLSIAALDEGDGEHGDPQAFFPDVMRLLHVAHSDVFLIIDCCYASKAFLSERHGRRKFELLASSMAMSPSPGKPGSFTAALIKVLAHLLNEPKHRNGFSTSLLYSHLFHHPDLVEYKPLLFDQSQFDYGKIWLRPQKSPAETQRLAQPSDVTLDLKIHLSLTKKDPIGLAMNELAKALKYLPHVRYIDYGELHAGDEEVAMFQQALSRASNVKKAIRLLRNKVKERKKKEPETIDPKRPIKRPPSFHQVLLKIDSSSTQDWSSGVAEFSDGTVVPLKSTPGVQNEPNAIQPSLQTHQRRRAWGIPGIFYLRYIIDFTGVWIAVARLAERLMPEQRSDPPHKHADVHPTVSNNPEATSSTDFYATNGGREWKHHGQRLSRERIMERIFWFACLCTVYMWSTGKG